MGRDRQGESAWSRFDDLRRSDAILVPSPNVRHAEVFLKVARGRPLAPGGQLPRLVPQDPAPVGVATQPTLGGGDA